MVRSVERGVSGLPGLVLPCCALPIITPHVIAFNDEWFHYFVARMLRHWLEDADATYEACPAALLLLHVFWHIVFSWSLGWGGGTLN